VIGLADSVFVDQIWWYTSRAAGIVAWVLLSASMIAGMSISSRDSRRFPTGWTLDLHRFLSTLSLVFLGVHLVALVPDNFIHFAWGELFVPMASEWEPAAVAWGIVAFWLMVAVEITSLLRTRMPNQLWKLIHLLSFVIWVSATIHLLDAGTDADATPFRVVQVGVIVAVSGLFVRRIVVARRRSSGRVRSLPIEESIDVDEIDSREGRELSAGGR
jgi:predicted ferric reductase